MALKRVFSCLCPLTVFFKFDGSTFIREANAEIPTLLVAIIHDGANPSNRERRPTH
jgi:hypothetical protein